MRKVKVDPINNEEPYYGYFHKWAVESARNEETDETETDTFAIVEKEDGQVKMELPTRIKFINEKKDKEHPDPKIRDIGDGMQLKEGLWGEKNEYKFAPMSFSVSIEKEFCGKYTGEVNELEDIIAVGDSVDEVKKELIISLKTFIAYKLGLSSDQLKNMSKAQGGSDNNNSNIVVDILTLR